MTTFADNTRIASSLGGLSGLGALAPVLGFASLIQAFVNKPFATMLGAEHLEMFRGLAARYLTPNSVGQIPAQSRGAWQNDPRRPLTFPGTETGFDPAGSSLGGLAGYEFLPDPSESFETADFPVSDAAFIPWGGGGQDANLPAYGRAFPDSPDPFKRTTPEQAKQFGKLSGTITERERAAFSRIYAAQDAANRFLTPEEVRSAAWPGGIPPEVASMLDLGPGEAIRGVSAGPDPEWRAAQFRTAEPIEEIFEPEPRSIPLDDRLRARGPGRGQTPDGRSESKVSWFTPLGGVLDFVGEIGGAISDVGMGVNQAVQNVAPLVNPALQTYRTVQGQQLASELQGWGSGGPYGSVQPIDWSMSLTPEGGVQIGQSSNPFQGAFPAVDPNAAANCGTPSYRPLDGTAGMFYSANACGNMRANDVIGVPDWRGQTRYWVGGKTLPKQKLKNFILTESRPKRRKCGSCRRVTCRCRPR